MGGVVAHVPHRRTPIRPQRMPGTPPSHNSSAPASPWHTRPPLARFQRILDALRRRQYPNASTLAAELECSPRTVQRDVAFLRDRLGAPIEFDPHRNGFHLSREGFELPSATITAADLAAILIADRAIAALGPLPLAKTVRAAADKLAAALPDLVRVGPEEQIAVLTFRGQPRPPVADAHFELLTKAVHERRRLEIQYRSATRGGARTERRIDPYALVVQEGALYLLGFCHRRQEVLTFSASRIDAARDTGERFVRPPDFNPDKYLDGAFRHFSGRRPIRVRVHFSSRVAIYLLERIWHPTQTTARRLDGSIEARFTITHLDELLRWVLSWGPEAEVLGPPTARNRARELAAATAALYVPPPSARTSATLRQRMSHPRRNDSKQS